MKYFDLHLMHYRGNIPNGSIVHITANHIKNKDQILYNKPTDETFFHLEDTIFDYLEAVIKTDDPVDDIDPNPKGIEMVMSDVMYWIYAEPHNGYFWTVSQAFKKAVDSLNIPIFRFYKTRLKIRDEFSDKYWVWQYLASSEAEYIDQEKTKYCFAIWQYRKEDIPVGEDHYYFNSYEEGYKFQKKLDKKARVKYKELVFQSHVKELDFIRIPNGNIIVSERFKEAIEKANLNGFLFQELDFEIKYSDEV